MRHFWEVRLCPSQILAPIFDGLATFACRIMCVMAVVLSAPAGNAGVSPTLRVCRLKISRLGFFGLLAVLVGSAGTTEPPGVWMFLGHVMGPSAANPRL